MEESRAGQMVTPPVRPQAGLVKWFDAERGFGFVILDGACVEAFLHAAKLVRGTHPVQRGDRVTCLLETGERGLQVSRVLSVIPAAPDNLAPVVVASGRVKFYDVGRGFGFILADDGQEVFVGAKALRRVGISPPLRADSVVRFTAVHGARGLVAETLSFPAGSPSRD